LPVTPTAVATGRRSSLQLGGRTAAALKRAAVVRLDRAVAEARDAERSPCSLERRIDDRLARLLEAARTTRHYSSLVSGVSDPRAVWAQLPVLQRDEFRARPTAFLTPSPESCFVRTTTGSSGEHGYVVKPRSSLTERAAIERRWFDSLSLPAFFDLTLVTAWRDVRPFNVRFNDWRVRYRAISVDRAREAMSKGKRIGDLVVSTPRIAESLRAVDTAGRHRYASSFEFSRPARALFRIESSDDPECASESYVAGELCAPVAFRFPDCPAFHVNADAVLVELADAANGRPVEDGVSGRIVVTDLLNTVMPLLRYELGDFGVVTGRGHCRCGRVTPRLRLLARELGRSDHHDDGLARRTASSDPSRLLVKLRTCDYLLFAPGGFDGPCAAENPGDVSLCVATDVPDVLAPLLACPTPLSVAERPIPA
jgi:hypothetical protein